MFARRIEPSHRESKAERDSEQHDHSREGRQHKPNCHKKYFQPGPCLRLHPSRMWHSFANTLSNRMNRITLLTYIITIRNTRPATTRTAMSPPRIAGSIFGKPCVQQLAGRPGLLRNVESLSEN